MTLADTRCPYVGLQPFGEADRDYFFGRGGDQRVVASNLYASNLTVLYGASGVGKSSILLAGVVPRLRAEPNTAVAVFRDWSRPDFLDHLGRCIREAILLAKPGVALPDAALPLDALLREAALTLRISVLVVLDQFEEYFLYHPESGSGGAFEEAFARAVNGADGDIAFLLALREDAVAQLDRFSRRIPGLLANTVRLRHLDRESALEAIRMPLQVHASRFPARATTIEPALESALVAAAQGRATADAVAGPDAGAAAETAPIETALLQLLLTKVWNAEPWPTSGARTLRLQTFVELGGAERVVERHLEEFLAGLTPEQLDLCARIFDRMVTPSGSKIACREQDLRRWAGDLSPLLGGVLQRLCTGDGRILRPIAAAAGDAGGTRYEVFHDVLGGAILAWRLSFLAARDVEALKRNADEQQRRADDEAQKAVRLRRALMRTRVLIGVAVVAVFVTWVFERKAMRESRASLARALSTAAINQSRSDQELGLLLALHGVAVAREVDDDAVRSAADALARSLAASLVRTSMKASGDLQLISQPFDADGRRMLMVDRGGSLRIVDGQSGRIDSAPALEGTPKVRAAGFSPSGRFVLVIGEDESAGLWDAATGKLRQRLPLPVGAQPHNFAFSADESRVVVGGGFTAWVIRLGTPGTVLALAGHPAPNDRLYTVTAVAINPHLPVVATAGFDQKIRLWSLDGGRELAVMSEHTEQIDDLKFSPDGGELLSASQDGTARVWPVVTAPSRAPLRSRLVLHGHANSVFRVAYSEDGDKIASASADTTVRLWDSSTGRPIALLAAHVQPVSYVGFADHGRALRSVDWGGTVKTWATGGHTGPPEELLFSPDGSIAVTIGKDTSARVWDVSTGDELRTLGGHERLVGSARFSPDGKRLASGDEAGTLRLWNPKTGDIEATLCCQRTSIKALDFSPDGTLLASAAHANVDLWNVARRERVTTLPGLKDMSVSFIKVAFSPDGHWLAAAGQDGTLLVWQLRSQTLALEARVHTNKIFAIDFSPDSKLLLTVSQDGAVAVWRTGGEQPPQVIGRHGAVVLSARFDRDGRRIFACDLQGSLRVWDVATHERLPGPPGHASTCSLALSADGRQLLSWSWDRTARIWDTATWREVASFAHADMVRWGALSPDGQRIGTVEDGVRILPIATDKLVQLAKSRLTRELTSAECESYFNSPDCPRLP